MKPLYEHIRPDSDSSILTKNISLPTFDSPFHFHPEFELTYIKKGEGLRYVGMRVDDFKSGDFVLLGQNLPHCWISNREDDGRNVEAYVLQFEEGILKDSVLKWREFSEVSKMLNLSKSGLVLDNYKAVELFETLIKTEPKRRIIYFLEILVELSNGQFKTIIDKPMIFENQDKLSNILDYVIKNFRENIVLEKVADLANMTPTSFCRYLKNHTGKTLFEIVLNYRLEAAKQLLLNTRQPINEIALEIGFVDIPYFNRTFKRWKGVPPREYRISSTNFQKNVKLN
jgi:AraC-like DNA-binding protein